MPGAAMIPVMHGLIGGVARPVFLATSSIENVNPPFLSYTQRWVLPHGVIEPKNYVT